MLGSKLGLHRDRARVVLLHTQSLGSRSPKSDFSCFPSAVFVHREQQGCVGVAQELSWGCCRREWVCLEAQADIEIRGQGCVSCSSPNPTEPSGASHGASQLLAALPWASHPVQTGGLWISLSPEPGLERDGDHRVGLGSDLDFLSLLLLLLLLLEKQIWGHSQRWHPQAWEKGSQHKRP